MLRSTRKRNFEDMQHSEVGEEFIRAPSYDSVCVCVFVCVCVCVCAGGWCFTSLRILRWEHIAVFLIHFLQIIFSFPIRMLEVCWVLGEQRLHKSLIWLGLLFRTGCHWEAVKAFASLGGEGKHPSNQERDLHNWLKRLFGFELETYNVLMDVNASRTQQLCFLRQYISLTSSLAPAFPFTSCCYPCLSLSRSLALSALSLSLSVSLSFLFEPLSL